MQLFDKQHIKKYSLIFIFITVFLLFTIMISIVHKDASQKSLELSVSMVLSQYKNGRFSIKNEFLITRPVRDTVRIYEVKDKEQNSDIVYAALVRITGFSGPQSCVLLLNPELNSCIFIGIAGIPFPQKETALDYGISDSMITYWKQTILDILISGGVM